MAKLLIVMRYLNQILQQLKILQRSMQRLVPSMLQMKTINIIAPKKTRRLCKNNSFKPTKNRKVRLRGLVLVNMLKKVIGKMPR